MKFNATNYSAKDVIRIMREWSGETQESFGKTIYKSQRCVQSYELGTRNCSLKTFLLLAKKYNIKVIITKDNIE